MSASIAYDPKRLTGFDLDQLAAAFDRVRNARDWKAPIRAVIATGERPLVEKAVLWFTDTVPTFTPMAGVPDRLIVTALGYRLGESESRQGHLLEDSQRILADMEAPAVPARPRTRAAQAELAEPVAAQW